MAKATLNLDKSFKIELDDTVDNTTLIPVNVLADVSYSMEGTPLQEQGDAIQTFIETLEADDYTRASIELSIMTFSNDVKVIHDYSFVEDIYFENNLQAENMTYMAKAVDYGIDSLQVKIQEYKEKGILYKAPLLVLITDGIPSDDITAAANRCADLVARRKLTFLGIGVGDDADMQELKRFNPNGNVLKSPTFEDLKELLVWVSYSLSAASQAGPGEEVENHVELDPKFKLF
jgi:uncharacterized protein YegL